MPVFRFSMGIKCRIIITPLSNCQQPDIPNIIDESLRAQWNMLAALTTNLDHRRQSIY